MQARRQPDRLGIYVHFPYCIQKCDYCDFFSIGLDRLDGLQQARQPDAHSQASSFVKQTTSVSDSALNQFSQALTREWQIRQLHFKNLPGPSKKIDSIFFGGGTASLMPVEMIAKFLQMFHADYDFAEQVEITLEGNPENFTAEYLRGLAEVGVNRVNVGLQTFQASFLNSMNRYYDKDRYNKILDDLGKAPIPARGIDLIYGFAGQTWQQFESDLKAVLAHDLNHLSIYSLTVEQATPYATAVSRGKRQPPAENLQTEIFQALPDLLAPHSFTQYEVSNYARQGFASRHNQRYWYYEPCLALGPGAHGFDGQTRYANSRSIPIWQKDPLSGTKQTAEPILEFPLSYLRLTSDLRVADFSSALARVVDEQKLLQSIHQTLNDWQDRKLVEPYSEAGQNEQALKETSQLDCFQWTMAGQMQLDNLIFEMTEALERVAP